MPSRRYMLLNPNAAGPSLAVDETGLRLTTTAACDMARTVLGDQIALAGTREIELYVWSQSRGDLSNLYGYGVAPPDFNVASAVGSGASYAFLPATGKVRTGGADVATVDRCAERVCLGLRLSLSPTSCTCAWLIDGNVVHQVTLPNGQAWVFALSMGSATPADVSASINAGQVRFDRSVDRAGWSTQTAGLPTFYLALANEGFMSLDTAGSIPANTPFQRALLNKQDIVIDRAPLAWFHREPGARYNPASLTALRLSNPKGVFNPLLSADVEDSLVVLDRLAAPAGAAGSVASAVRQLSGSLNRVEANNNIIDLRLRDRLATLDHLLPMRVIPPFYDDASAGQAWPLGLGPRRSVAPKVLDSMAGLYALGDSPQSNVVFAGDGGAPLDPGASPPQYTPALGGAGIHLEVPTEFKFTVDCSNQGGQAPLPGTPDILGGLGAFTTWTAGAPNGFQKCTNPPWAANVVANGLMQQTSAYGSPSSVYLSSNVGFDVASGRIGYPGLTLAGYLQPGRSYVFRFKLLRSLGYSPNSKWGFAIVTKVSTDPRYWVTPHMEPIGEVWQSRYCEFIYDVPATEVAPLPVYFTCISEFSGSILPTSSYATAVIDDLTIEERAAYVPGEMEGVNLRQALASVLVDREGLPPAAIAFDDADAIDAATGYQIGVHEDDPPNTLDLLTKFVDNWGGVVYTDADDVIHVGRLTPPEDGEIVAAFAEGNFSLEDDDEFWIGPDPSPGLTCLFSGRPNISPFGDTDFVSDQIVVPESRRAILKRADQVLYTSNVQTAQRHPANKPRHRFQFDRAEFVQAEGDRVNRLFEVPRNLCIFVARYTGNLIGLGPSIEPEKIRYNHAITVDRPEKGLFTQRMKVVRWRHHSGAKKMLLKGWF